MIGLIFQLAFDRANHENQTHSPGGNTSEGMVRNISLGVMGFVLLSFIFLLINTRLVSPDGKAAAYLVQEQGCMIGV
jgi:hypothetical protein